MLFWGFFVCVFIKTSLQEKKKNLYESCDGLGLLLQCVDENKCNIRVALKEIFIQDYPVVSRENWRVF